MVVALRPGRCQLRARGPGGTGEAIVGLTQGSALRVREFRTTTERSPRPRAAGHPRTQPVPPRTSSTSPARGFTTAWVELTWSRSSSWMSELGTQWRRVRDGAADAVEEFRLADGPDPASLPEHALALALADRQPRQPCRWRALAAWTRCFATPACPPPRAQCGFARQRTARRHRAPARRLPVGDWLLLRRRRAHGGRPIHGGNADRNVVWWWPDGTRRQRGTYAGGKRAGAWIDYRENGQRRKRTIYSRSARWRAAGVVRQRPGEVRRRSVGRTASHRSTDTTTEGRGRRAASRAGGRAGGRPGTAMAACRKAATSPTRNTGTGCCGMPTAKRRSAGATSKANATAAGRAGTPAARARAGRYAAGARVGSGRPDPTGRRSITNHGAGGPPASAGSPLPNATEPTHAMPAAPSRRPTPDAGARIEAAAVRGRGVSPARVPGSRSCTSSCTIASTTLSRPCGRPL